MRAFLLRLNRFLETSLEGIIGGLEIGEVSALEAARVLGSMQAALIDLGLADELGELQGIYADELNYISQVFAASGIAGALFSDVDETVIRELVSFDTDQVFGMVSGYVDDVKATMMRAVLIGETPNFREMHDVTGSRLISNLETEMTTALQGFSRTVTQAKGKELGFELWEYIGPEDEITREFCQDLLDKDPPIYSTSEIERMDNGQGLPVASYGGGYNCRHQWRPISEEKAREAGWE